MAVSFDYTNPGERLHLQFLSMFAEYFSAKLSAHAHKGKVRREGPGCPTGIAPFGYLTPSATADEVKGRGSTKRIPQVVPQEAEAVRLIFTLYASSQHGDAEMARMAADPD